MVLDPIPQSLPVHFFGSRPQPPTSLAECCVQLCLNEVWLQRAMCNCVWMKCDCRVLCATVSEWIVTAECYVQLCLNELWWQRAMCNCDWMNCDCRVLCAIVSVWSGIAECYVQLCYSDTIAHSTLLIDDTIAHMCSFIQSAMCNCVWVHMCAIVLSI